MTDEQNRPSQETWRRLYEAAVAFKETTPWNWMYDSDLFGVRNPLTGEIGYSCVLGAAGEVFGLTVYRGSDGLDVYLDLESRQIGGNDPDLLFIQRCLMADFQDREMLDKTDRDVIGSLGLTFRGRNAWPQFRSYIPGYVPWHLTDTEASFLAAALEQTIAVSLRFRENPSVLDSPSGYEYLVRTAKQEEGKWVWQDEWLNPDPVEEKELSFEPLNEERLAQIKDVLSPSDQIWEGDFFHIQNPVKEEGRPYYPRLFVWADVRSGCLFGQDMNRPDEPITLLRECLLEILERSDIYPREIRVRKPEAVELLAPLAESLDIKLVKAKGLPAIDAFRRAIPDFFRRTS